MTLMTLQSANLSTSISIMHERVPLHVIIPDSHDCVVSYTQCSCYYDKHKFCRLQITMCRETSIDVCVTILR